METSQIRYVLLAAVAPLAWGTTYWVTTAYLPDDRPLLAATLRALPAGLLLLLWSRRMPRGDWWWRSAVLGTISIGLFFPLIFVAAYELPGGVASTLQATSPLAVMGLAWWLIAERSSTRRILASLVGGAGVGLLVLEGGATVSVWGVAAGLASVAVSALGFVLVKKWEPPVDMVTVVSWQLVWAGLLLAPVALIVEGTPPPLSATNAAGFAWLSLVGTAAAYVCWFTSLRRIPAGAVALVGLLNPLVGTVLGVVLAREVFGTAQALGAVLIVGGVVAGQQWRSRPRARTGPELRWGSDTAAVPSRPPGGPVAPACR